MGLQIKGNIDMSPSLKQYNGDYQLCRFEQHVIDNFIIALQENTAATKESNKNHANITRFLVVVVCIIALGSKLLDIIEPLIKPKIVKEINDIRN